jgi:N-acetylmuramoyl-L-alanine amidase
LKKSKTWLGVTLLLFAAVAKTVPATEVPEEEPIIEVPTTNIVVHEYTEEELEEQEYDDSLELLALCVEAEAGNQDQLGKRLVVDVILNRVDSPRFPNSIEEVITQKGQFEAYETGKVDLIWSPSEETYEAVKMELENRTDTQILFFTYGRYNPHCIPMYQHGDHYFGR